MKVKAPKPRKLTKVTKRLTVKQFREMGLLHEVNRRVLHPLGYALETIVNVDEKTNKIVDDDKERFGEVWDYGDDPEGMRFEEMDQESIDKVKALEDKRRPTRVKALGYWVQGES